jgi:CheY-like chemotaxis protein
VRIQPSGAGVLILEDHPELRESLALLLEDLGYPVAVAANGWDALAHLQSAPPPALILLDLIMPVMNGWVFRAEQQRDPELADTPVVVVSGAASLPYQSAALNAVACLTKPVDLNILLALVDQYCQ